jgi:two-component system CheB/CheR fusion protein
MEKMIDGLVITFVDITKVTLAERTARAAQAFFQGLVETVREPVLVLDDQLRLISANRAFYEAFQLIPALAENKVIDEIAPGGISDPGLRPLLEQVRTGQTMIEDFKLSGDFPRLGHREFVINARRLEQAPGLPGMILLAVEDRTGK